jgi:hypothetical protein
MNTKISIVLLLLICLVIENYAQPKRIQTKSLGIYTPPKRQRANNELPNEIKVILNTQYPGWQFVDNYYIFDFENEMLKKQRYSFDPNFIIGDFNEDANQDFAIQIAIPRLSDSTELFLVFLLDSEGFKQHVLDSAQYYSKSDMYLWLSKKGTKGYNFDLDTSFVFPKDAVTIEYWERASVTYLYSRGSFERIITGD